MSLVVDKQCHPGEEASKTSALIDCADITSSAEPYDQAVLWSSLTLRRDRESKAARSTVAALPLRRAHR